MVDPDPSNVESSSCSKKTWNLEIDNTLGAFLDLISCSIQSTYCNLEVFALSRFCFLCRPAMHCYCLPKLTPAMTATAPVISLGCTACGVAVVGRQQDDFEREATDTISWSGRTFRDEIWLMTTA